MSTQPQPPPDQHNLHIHSYDHDTIRVQCTCGGFELDFPSGTPLANIIYSHPILQYIESNAMQARQRYLANLALHGDRPPTPATPATSATALYGESQPSQAETYERHGVQMYVGDLTLSEQTQKRIGEALHRRSVELTQQAQKLDQQTREHGIEDPHISWVLNLRNEMRYLAALLDPTETEENRRRLRP
jgi:hypothetical protein